MAVGERFHVKPLLPLFAGDGRYFVLALNLDNVRLLAGSHYSLAEMDLPDTPRSLEEALKYDEFETQQIDPVSGALITVDSSGLTPRNAPEWTIGFGFTLTYEIGPGALSLTGKYAWRDSLFFDLDNLTEVGSTDNYQASLSYTYENWIFTVFGRNLGDEFNELPIVIPPLFASGTIGPRGRSYGVEITYEWAPGD